ncbi:hypothetical protein [Vibrio celticus]|uniref:hypothetical protein n=1 Tax=Vibrio celticus TaxID=446372 RepID=UPI0040683499
MSFSLEENIFDDFNNNISGSYGVFKTPSGNVNYLQVTARITPNGVELSDNLSGILVPVREILDTKEMNFGQLLQRDLDDHRVATKLVPYILKGNDIGPAFFPPIQAILLPFNVNEEELKPRPVDNFGEYIETPLDTDKYGMHWKGYQYSESYRFEKMSFKNGNEAPYREGKLRWHDKRAQLVVIDGQHRAMAMLAIYRTLHKKWKGTGSQYRHFYQDEITSLLKDNPTAQDLLKEGIEYPVTITWFDNETNHHKAARKLFVDVNKNAKPPTKSRLILLGETELKDVFSRKILDNLRNDESSVPLYSIEYDYNSSNNSQVGKWSALVNIEMLKSAITRCIWGPNKYITDLDVRVSSGRDSQSELDSRFRKQMQVDQWYPAEFKSDNGDIYPRDNLGNFSFPRELLPEFESKFSDGWGRVILNILSEFLPYKCHSAALTSMKKAWADVDNEATLGFEAIFEGVGLFWTLKDSYDHWGEEQKERKKNKSIKDEVKPDTVKAWEYIKKKEIEFYKVRNKKYYGSSERHELVQDSFTKMNSYACLVGLSTAIASIAHKHNIIGSRLDSLSLEVVQLINNWLETGQKNRKLFLSTKTKNSLNLLPKLDHPCWVYFRYFWFEVINDQLSNESWESEFFDKEYITSNLSDMRKFYFETVIKPEQEKALEKISDLEGEAFSNKVMKQSTDKYNKVLSHWFNCSFTYK